MSSALVLRGGRVFDPANGVDACYDVRIENGRIVDIGADLPVPSTITELRLNGALVTPGLIDFHVHAYPQVTTLGLEPDSIGVYAGVTTIVDTGSAGAYTFDGFRRWVVGTANTRVVCFLNFSAVGIPNTTFAELGSPALLDREAALRTIKANRDVIKGLKIRASHHATHPMGLEAIRLAKETANEAGVPLLVHLGEPRGVENYDRTLTPRTLELLDAGDIVVHGLTARAGGIFSDDGLVLPEARAARERGVWFDVGHGSNNVSFHVLRIALEQNVEIDSISSDINTGNTWRRVFSLPIVLSKFIAAGFSLSEVITKATYGPAKLLGLAEEVGVKVGAPADLSVFEVYDGTWEFVDSEGETICGSVLLSPIMTVRAGRVFPAMSSRVYPTERYD